MTKFNEAWLVENAPTERPAELGRKLFERLKIVAGLLAEAPSAPRAAPRLLWRNERGEVVSFELPEKLCVGREAGCGLTLENPRVSRRQCEITLLRGVAWLSDLGSSNGTLLNDRQVSVPVPLSDGDVITLGGAAVIVYCRGN